MKQTKRSLLPLLLVLCLVLTSACGRSKASEPLQANDKVVSIVRNDWADDVKTALNACMAAYGKNGTSPAETPYVVFDFDNTSSIFDVEEQLAIYQLSVMAFAVQPKDLQNVLLSGLQDVDTDVTDYGYGKGASRDWIDDIASAYGALWTQYGPFSAEGVPENRRDALHADPEWQEFSAKMRALYSLIYDVQSSDVAYPWVLYWFTGMTEDEIPSTITAWF